MEVGYRSGIGMVERFITNHRCIFEEKKENRVRTIESYSASSFTVVVGGWLTFSNPVGWWQRDKLMTVSS